MIVIDSEQEAYIINTKILTEKGKAKTMEKPMMTIAVAALAMGVMADAANTVNITKFHQSYPYSGTATVEYTVGGTLPANAFAEFTISTDDASATFTSASVATGSNSYTIDFASSFGGALVLTNASFAVKIACGVQLWKNGPYWAECNVGATRPEESGYYFWWGDTVGYKRENDAWVAADGSTSNFSFSSDNVPTEGMSYSQLFSAGYIDSTTNLVAAHDAATVHLGSPWRMPTRKELNTLLNNCTTTWMTTNGVYGRLVTGTGDYADKSIFLPCVGHGSNTGIFSTPEQSVLNSRVKYWSSTPYWRNSLMDYAYCLDFGPRDIQVTSNYDRRIGSCVRPVQNAGQSDASGIITYDLPQTHTTTVAVPYDWLRQYYPEIADTKDAYETAAHSIGANGYNVWESYVIGADPEDSDDVFKIVSFPMNADGTPNLDAIEVSPPKAQWNVKEARLVLEGKTSLDGDGEWQEVTDDNKQDMRFFMFEVELP